MTAIAYRTDGTVMIEDEIRRLVALSLDHTISVTTSTGQVVVRYTGRDSHLYELYGHDFRAVVRALLADAEYREDHDRASL